MKESLWFTTRSALFRPGDEAWNEVAAYAEPLERLLRRRYPGLQTSDRDDLIQELLVEMKEKLVDSHDRSRGPFRALLQTVVKRKVGRHLRAGPKSSGSGDVVSLRAPDALELDALDLETGLKEAVARCQERLTQSGESGVLFVLVDRIVHGRSNIEMARERGVSVHQIARLLRKGRETIFRCLLERELDLRAADPRLEELLAVFKLSLRRPRRTQEHLQHVEDRRLRERTQEFLDRFRAAIPYFDVSARELNEEFRRGLHLILVGESAEDVA